MTFTRETQIKAVRKPRPCEGCRKRIEAGEPAVQWVGRTDGDFGAYTYHTECRQAEIDLNKLHDSYWDDWIGLQDNESDDHEWLLAEYPVVAARLGITAGTIKADIEEQQRCRAAWARLAPVGTRPKGGDTEGGSMRSTSDAVPKAGAQTPASPTPNSPYRRGK